MGYTTIAAVRANEHILETSNSPDLIDAVVEDRIDRADLTIKTDLSGVADFTFSTTPVVIESLSNYKATELCLIWLYTRKRQGLEQDDIQYWHQLYETLKEKVLSGDVSLGDADNGTGTFTNSARKDVKPALGVGKWGGFKTLNDLQKDRPTND